jgi:hypothetical protein
VVESVRAVGGMRRRVYNYNEGTDHNLSKTSLYRLKCGKGYYANFGGAFTYLSPDWVGAHIYSGYDGE